MEKEEVFVKISSKGKIIFVSLEDLKSIIDNCVKNGQNMTILGK